MEKIQISGQSVIDDLHNGITRCIGDANYDPERGSIQEKYNLTKTQVRELFKHPRLKGVKVKSTKDSNIELVADFDDLNNENVESDREIAYGERSAASLARLELVEDQDPEESKDSASGSDEDIDSDIAIPATSETITSEY